MGIEIRKAKQEDALRIHRLNKFGAILNKCSPLDRLDPKDKPERGQKNYYEIYIHGKKKWCYVAEENGRLLGFILFKVKNREPFWKVKRVGYIDLIFIEKKARRKGIAMKFFNKADEIFRKEKLQYVTLSVQTANGFAHNIWKRFGYEDHLADMWKKL